MKVDIVKNFKFQQKGKIGLLDDGKLLEQIL